MKLYSLDYVSLVDGAGQRIWHTNRHALERYAKTLSARSFRICGIRSYELPTPVTDARLMAFLNRHCVRFMPDVGERDAAPGGF